jgi:DnaJ-class molecular chaperone
MECSVCKGEGKVIIERDAYDPDAGIFIDYVDCLVCGGSGKFRADHIYCRCAVIDVGVVNR